ncbi:hypothetical protein DCMF_07030 [Candidatus Formimonas warabiya]|uniref:Uncharacterized protein n=2 Tax=Formimonas warabiya TaxID=1761012 RepID=A0A3G1L191_FORW1|nr:hypothetical protein DCMF_07030 [Candidatus Formimonas warabiya]
MAHLTQDMTELKQTVGDINDRVGKLEVKVEHEVMGKINVLFDVQQQHTEQLNRIEEKVSTHEEFIIKRIK